MAKDIPEKRTELALRQDVAISRHVRALQVRYQGLWFSLARANWASLVVVPAEEGDSAAGIATALADVGRRLRNTPVTFLVMAGGVDYASAGRFLGRVTDARGKGAEEPPASRVIVAVPPVVTEPLALAVTHAADAVAIFVRLGRTHRSSVSRTIELVGKDKVMGSILG